ncbi:MAG: DNA repair protein RadC [Verrucomicrobiota bacterium]|nr:DNA repair protein RadC [Verrucomicrobiota bacterium]
MENPPLRSLRLRDMAVNERPQERLERHGARHLSDTDLLAMILRSGSVHLDVLGVSATLLAQAGSLANLLKWTETDLRQIKGIGKVKALQLITVLEIARRILIQQGGETPELSKPEAVFAHLAPLAAGLEVEKFWTICLNRKNRLIKLVEITSGTATGSLAHPREVFREAIRVAASAIIVAHNHPSGDPFPSSQDVKTTRQLRDAAGIIGIDLLDHIIVGRPEADPTHRGYYSFAQAGML